MKGIKNNYINYIDREVKNFIEHEQNPLIHCEENFISRSDFIKKLTSHELSGVLFNSIVAMLVKRGALIDDIPLNLESVLYEAYFGYFPNKTETLTSKQKEIIKHELAISFERINELTWENELHDIDDLMTYDNSFIVMHGKDKVLGALYDIHYEGNSICNLLDLLNELIVSKLNYNASLIDREGHLSKEETFFCRKMSGFLFSAMGVKGYQIIANFVNILFDKEYQNYFDIQTVAQRVSRGRRDKKV